MDDREMSLIEASACISAALINAIDSANCMLAESFGCSRIVQKSHVNQIIKKAVSGGADMLFRDEMAAEIGKALKQYDGDYRDGIEEGLRLALVIFEDTRKG